MIHAATLCVLAGGEAKRMGHAKAELTIDGKPILAHLLDRLNWPGPTLLVTAPGREHPPACERFNREAIDPVSGRGPLQGLLTALQNIQTDLAVVVTVDMPWIERAMIDWLVQQIEPAAQALMTRDQPFPSICRTIATDSIRRNLESENRSMFSLFDEPGFITRVAPKHWDAKVWTNLNTPDDLTACGLQ